jgi:hypothetical protein
MTADTSTSARRVGGEWTWNPGAGHLDPRLSKVEELL